MMELEGNVSEAVNRLLYGKDEIELLEAGCGSATHLKLNTKAYVVGIDISGEQLEKHKKLDERIQGDIQVYPLPPNRFDAIICWMVLEHVQRPFKALENFSRTIKPGGIIILGFPNLYSIKGIVTKFSPHWFHKLFYKLMKYKVYPFPTYFCLEVAPPRLVEYAKHLGLTVEFFKLQPSQDTRIFMERFVVARLLLSAVNTFTKLISMGRLNSPLADQCGIILSKPIGTDQEFPTLQSDLATAKSAS
ncbi:MAG TPA: methyltransferase domain-containing protein [Terracidiphilus sp.]|nr:methyltransferase domain-containing protein [Terracidiphilus sp.]